MRYRPYADLSLSQLLALSRGITNPEAFARTFAPAPALPRLPADLLRECAEAAGLATCNPEE